MRPRISSLACLLTLSAVAAPQNLDIPPAGWERIFFRSIDSLTNAASWPRLRRADLPDGALEIRVWVGFGLTRLEGFRLRRGRSGWTAQHLRAGFGEEAPLELQEVRPESNWETLWKKIEELGVLTLPDASSLPGERMYLDGVSYVFEVSDGRNYRTYQYGNPQYQKWPEARKSIAIVNALYEELLPKRK
jgi:hypothetical protein